MGRNKINFNCNLYGVYLEKVEVVRDLGVLFKSNLPFSAHIERIKCKAFKTLGFLLRHTKEFENKACLKSLYCAFLRPILEYGSLV